MEGVLIGELDLMTACIHHSELQTLTSLLLISTIHSSSHAKSFFNLLCLQQPFHRNSF
jgi:hypothetical protein